MPSRNPKRVKLSCLTALATITACDLGPTNERTIDGWEISTAPPDMLIEGSVIYVGKNGEPILSIWDVDGRRIFLAETGHGDTVEIRDLDEDGKFDFLSYKGQKYWTFDNDFDGESDVLNTIADGTLRIRYKDQWHQIQKSDGLMYINLGDRKIEIKHNAEKGLVPVMSN